MPAKTEQNNIGLSIWDQVEKTDKKVTKSVNYGQRKFTAIDAYSQFKIATNLFGPIGIGWGVSGESYSEFSAGLLMYQATLWYQYNGNRGEFPISSGTLLFRGEALNSDAFKIARTDAITKGLSMLGFNADVFMGAFDGNKYDGDKGRSSGGRGSKKGDNDGSPGMGKPFGSKYGTDKKPGKCGFCGKNHIIKNMPMVYVGKVCGAKSCEEAYVKSQSGTTDDAGGKANGKAETETDKIDGMERIDVLAHIRAGEKEITGGNPDDVAQIREANLNSARLDTSKTDELKVYLRWLIAQVKAAKQ